VNGSCHGEAGLRFVIAAAGSSAWQPNKPFAAAIGGAGSGSAGFGVAGSAVFGGG
jgi:hypothetical protein